MPALRHYWVPASGGRGWEFVEARKVPGRGWELRRPGKFGARVVVGVPVPGEDWVEIEMPQRAPKPPLVQAKAGPGQDAADVGPAKPRPRAVRVVVEGETAAEAKPRAVPERPARAAGARHTKPVPKLSRQLMDLMAQAQRDEPAPAGKAKCPKCGVILTPMKVRKVRTHDDPLKGARCEASGQKLA